MSICPILTHWVHRTQPEVTGFDPRLWEAEQHPLEYVSISKVHDNRRRVTVVFTTVDTRPDLVKVRCNSNWREEDEPKGWYDRRDAVSLYHSLAKEGYTCDVL